MQARSAPAWRLPAPALTHDRILRSVRPVPAPRAHVHLAPFDANLDLVELAVGRRLAV